MAEVKERSVAEAVLAPKLAGTLALAQVFGDMPMDFVALCSSITAVVGGFGQVDYCAANAFMDAYANSDHGWSAPLVSQNWGGWAEVGMAAESSAPAGLLALGTGTVERPLEHPVLTSVLSGPDRTVLHGRVSARSHWLLDEHRIGGQPVVPGTGHLECVRAALAAAVPAPPGATAIELRDVVFLEPFAVPDGAVAEYRVELTPADGGVDFAVRSLCAGRLGTHVHGWAGWTDEPAPRTLDVAAIAAGCTRVTDGEAFGQGRSSMVSFGPRWAGLREHHHAGSQELARIEAPEAAAVDLTAWGLHPALLDVATAFGRGRGQGTYLPMSYGRVVVRGALPAAFHSHLRYRDGGTDEVVSADVSLVDSSGQEIVGISDFLLRRVNEEAVTAGLSAPAPARPAARASTTGEGIAPADGAEAFLRSIAGIRGPQVVITTRSVADVRQRAGAIGTAALSADAGSSVTPGDSGRGDIEAVIAQVWCDVLGVDAVGVDDDFFALGGNSLIATQMIAAMRKATGVRLPMRSLFETPSVAGIAARIDELRAAQTPEDPQVSTIPRLSRA